MMGLGQNMAMKADGLISTQDSFHLSVYLPDSAIEFIIEPQDPCLVSCYFPPTQDKIDSLFNFNDGTYQNLGHKLDIVQPSGLLRIADGSKMEISCNKYLRNRDSLLLVGGCGDDKTIQPCDNPSAKFKINALPGLIVSSGSALVLDSGSFTQIGNNAAIIIKTGGTLVVKDSAKLLIGGGYCGGKGQLIAEPGSYVYIQKGAKISFDKIIGDTVDKHEFIVSLKPTHLSAISGVNSIILPLLVDDTILTNPLNHPPIAFCELKNYMSPVVKNNDWGFANFLPAKANIKLGNDTLCSGEPLIVDLRRILNDKKFSFKVCRLDSMFLSDNNGNWRWVDTCIVDTMSVDSNFSDPGCIPPRVTPDWFIYHLKSNETYRVSFKLESDCEEEIDTVFYVHQTTAPTANISIKDSVCEGLGTTALSIQTNFIGNYTVEINELNTASIWQNSTSEISDKPPLFFVDTIGVIPDTIHFPTTFFKGGRKYLISLVLKNTCGKFYFEDTLSVPTGANVQLSRPTVYANPIHGARSLQLNGFVNTADSFSWHPSTYLNRTDTLSVISTPMDSIYYVLAAYKNACVSFDTAFIKYNRVANAGLQDTVCFTGTKTLLGNAYDLSVFLGFMYYKGGSTFRDDWFINKTTANNEYFKYLSLFMQTNQFKNWAQSGNLYNDFTEDLHRAQTIKAPWFINYFEQLRHHPKKCVN